MICLPDVPPGAVLCGTSHFVIWAADESQARSLARMAYSQYVNAQVAAVWESALAKRDSEFVLRVSTITNADLGYVLGASATVLPDGHWFIPFSVHVVDGAARR